MLPDADRESMLPIVTRFSQILGQPTALATLRRAYAADRLPHALIFAGPVGVGKSTTARALSGLFLCKQPTSELEPCGRCDACRAFGANAHPDFHVVYRQLIRLEKESSKARDLSIDTIRDHLVHPAGLKAVMGHGKAFIVEEADTMSVAAQNSLLKTLEEPAGRTVIILVTDQPESLLPTIRSRCQIVRFGALDEATVTGELARRGISPEDAADAARFAEGSLGVALQWLEDGVVPRARELARKTDDLLAGRPWPDLPEWVKSAADAYAAKQLERDELASKDQATKEGLALYLRLAANQFRRTLPLADPENADRACRAIEAIDRAGNYLDANVNATLVLQQLTVEFDRQLAHK